MQDSVTLVVEPELLSGGADTVVRSQIFKYLIAGATAAAIDLILFHLLSTWINPCDGSGMTDDVRSVRFAINKTASFAIANSLSYWLNVRWVFEGGKHKRLIEVALFLGVSTLSYLVGMQVGRMLIETIGISSHIAAVLCIGVSTVLNFTLRKLLVFRG